MASQSAKKLAANNSEVLNNTHKYALVVNIFVLLFLIIFKRPASFKAYFIFSIPSFILQYILEKNGRPVYKIDASTNNSKLVRAGDDVSQEGLYEYMFDVLYVTWILDILMVLTGTNKIWWLYSIIPGYAGLKLFNVVLPFIKGMKGNKDSKNSEKETQEPTKSKRQTKLESRKAKGQNIRYR